MPLADNLTEITADQIRAWRWDDLIHAKEHRCIVLKLLLDMRAATREQIHFNVIVLQNLFTEGLRVSLRVLRQGMFGPPIENTTEHIGEVEIGTYLARLHIAWSQLIPSIFYGDEDLSIIPWRTIAEDEVDLNIFRLEMETICGMGEQLFQSVSERAMHTEPRRPLPEAGSPSGEVTTVAEGTSTSSVPSVDQQQASVQSLAQSTPDTALDRSSHDTAEPEPEKNTHTVFERQSSLHVEVAQKSQPSGSAESENGEAGITCLEPQPIRAADGGESEVKGSRHLDATDKSASSDHHLYNSNTTSPTMTHHIDMSAPNDEPMTSDEFSTVSTPSPEDEQETDLSMESQLGAEQDDRALQFEQSTRALRAESRQAQDDGDDGELRHLSTSPSRSDTDSRASQGKNEEVEKDAVTPQEMDSSSQLHHSTDVAGLSQPTTAATQQRSENIKPAGEDERMTEAMRHDLPHSGATASASPDETGLHSEQAVNSFTDSALTQFVSIFPMATGASVEEAHLYAPRTNCNIPEAVQLYMADKFAKAQEQTPNTAGRVQVEDGRPATLLDQALAAAKPRRVQKDGDLVIILDGRDLSKTYRLRSENVASASPLFRRLMSHEATTSSAHGVKYLFVLQNSSAEDGMPWLQPKELDIMWAGCEDDCYKKPSLAKEDSVLQEKSSEESAVDMIKSEQDVDMQETPQTKNKPDTAVQLDVDWLGAYEIFIRIIARVESGNYGVSKTDIDTAVDKIELVAQIAKATNAVSRISSALDSVISNFIFDQQLWQSIAKDASRWLLIGINLEKALIYNEAFVHVAGRYPEWPWSVPMKNIPHDVLIATTAKSVALDLARRDVERKLLLKTLIRKVTTKQKDKSVVTVTAPVGHKHNPAEFSVVNIFRDWLAHHLNCIDCSTQTEAFHSLKYHLCDHTAGDCMTYAGLLHIISKGGDSYLPVEWLLSSYWNRGEFPIDAADEAKIRSCLKDLKTYATELVAPLLASTLKFEGRDKLQYLTAIRVGEEDVPWDTTVKGEMEIDDDESEDF